MIGKLFLKYLSNFPSCMAIHICKNCMMALFQLPDATVFLSASSSCGEAAADVLASWSLRFSLRSCARQRCASVEA